MSVSRPAQRCKEEGIDAARGQEGHTLGALIKPFEVVTFEFGDHALRDVRVGQFHDVWSEYERFLQERGILP
jgi:hypothetical protein